LGIKITRRQRARDEGVTVRAGRRPIRTIPNQRSSTAGTISTPTSARNAIAAVPPRRKSAEQRQRRPGSARPPKPPSSQSHARPTARRRMIDPVVILVASVGRGRFCASLDGRVLVSSTTTPLLDAARVLTGEGVDPATRIVMRHVDKDYDALTSTVGVAAKLAIREETSDGKPRFVKWQPYGGPNVPVASPISETDPAVTQVPEVRKHTSEAAAPKLPPDEPQSRKRRRP
jgi:hypothetical protein